MIIDFIKNLVLDILFPKICLGCGKEGPIVCADCVKTISFLDEQKCPACRKISHAGTFCSKKCTDTFYFDQLIVSTLYKNKSLIQKMITSFKYKFSEEVVFMLSEILKTEYVYFSQYCSWLIHAIFIPVPLHSNRLKYRGFNQSLLLAEYLKKSLDNDPLLQNEFSDICITDCLIRQKYTREQAKLSRTSRLKNLTNCISVKPEIFLRIEI